MRSPSCVICHLELYLRQVIQLILLLDRQSLLEELFTDGCKKICESPNSEIVLHKPLPGRPRLTLPRTLNILKWQVEADPTLTARQLKERNPLLLDKVGVRTIQKRLKLDLGYKRMVAKKRPAITAKQKANRLKSALENIKKYKRKWRKNAIQ